VIFALLELLTEIRFDFFLRAWDLASKIWIERLLRLSRGGFGFITGGFFTGGGSELDTLDDGRGGGGLDARIWVGWRSGEMRAGGDLGWVVGV
jgi:hypothetical protein